MKRILLAAAAAASAAFLTATAANATVTITVDPAVTDYASDLAAVPDSQIVWDFDSITKAGFSFTGGVFSGTVTNTSQAPLGDDTHYGSVQVGISSPSVFTSAQLMKSFSFLVGSPDYYNEIVFRGPSGIVADLVGGAAFPGLPTDGENIARRITYDFGSSLVNEVDFYSTQNAFEFDRFAAGVPEPGAWAMMLLGFFGMGALLRKKRTAATHFA